VKPSTIKTTIKTRVWVIYGVCAIVFLSHRYLIRPWVVAEGEVGALLVVVNSIPNLLEGIVGTMLLAGIGLSIRVMSRPNDLVIDSKRFYHVVSLIAGAYVITQETNWFNVTRPNVYDPYDLVASLLGLVIINRLLISGGMLNRSVRAV
jgi:hypothetical protein